MWDQDTYFLPVARCDLPTGESFRTRWAYALIGGSEGIRVNMISHSLNGSVLNDSTHSYPIFSLFCQWLKKSTRVNPAQIVKRSLRWRPPPYTDPPLWLWKKNPKKNERAQRKGLLLWAKPTDKCPLLASSRGSELPSLLSQRRGVVKGEDQDRQTLTYCVSSSCASPCLDQKTSSVLWGLCCFWFLTKGKAPGSKRQKNI